eukprot:2344236-Amphidinium_carterae.1
MARQGERTLQLQAKCSAIDAILQWQLQGLFSLAFVVPLERQRGQYAKAGIPHYLSGVDLIYFSLQ